MNHEPDGNCFGVGNLIVKYYPLSTVILYYIMWLGGDATMNENDKEKYYAEIVAAFAQKTVNKLCVANWILSTAVIILAGVVVLLRFL